MTVDDRLSSARGGDRDPPPGLAPLLRALWLDARGDWDGAHAIAQDEAGRDGAWVHAYLHRKEGDAGNAAYWYGRARRPAAVGSLEEEWRGIAGALIQSAAVPGR